MFSVTDVVRDVVAQHKGDGLAFLDHDVRDHALAEHAIALLLLEGGLMLKNPALSSSRSRQKTLGESKSGL